MTPQKHPPRYQHFVQPKAALWVDVVDAMDGKPYGLMKLIGISHTTIALAKKKGYFSEGLSHRIKEAVCNRIKLINMSDADKRI